MTVTLTDSGLSIDGREVAVYSGAVHYWRLERHLWTCILDRVQELGFEIIETYIPWSVHEIAPGRFDWGTIDERKDIEAFIRLCEERGLWLLVRPGPLINAELTNFGFPDWVLLDPDVQARTSVGSLHLDAAWGLHPPHQFPVPSYASERFYEYVGQWFDAVCPMLTRHLAPAGAIVAVQSDNETSYMFHDRAYATDYSDASLALYRAFLQDRYISLQALNSAYSTCFTDFAQVEPPRDCAVQDASSMAWHVDWTTYKEYQISWSLIRISCMLRERGVRDVPVFHDVAFRFHTPLDIARLEEIPEIDWVGMNLYRNKEGYRGAMQRMRYLAGTTRLPFVPEMGCGIWSHHPLTPTADEQEFIMLLALMHGLKAFNLYMLVERERWQGSPITRHGTLRPDYAAFYQRLLVFARRYQLWSLRREPRALLLLNYDLGRYRALASTLHLAHADLYGFPSALFTVELPLDFQWDVAREADYSRYDNWLGTVIASFESRSLDYDLSDTHSSLARLCRYPLVFVPTVDFMDVQDQERLLAYVKQGGQLVIGPGLPALDPALQPYEILKSHVVAPGGTAYGAGSLWWIRQDEVSTMVEDLIPESEYRCDNEQILLIQQKNDLHTLLFLANPTSQVQETMIRFSGQRRFRGIWNGPSTCYGDGAIDVKLEPFTVQIWEVCHD